MWELYKSKQRMVNFWKRSNCKKRRGKKRKTTELDFYNDADREKIILNGKRFFFNKNESLIQLFQCCDISLKYLEKTEKDVLSSNKDRKIVFLILLKLCRCTGSKQLLRYVNIYNKKDLEKYNDNNNGGFIKYYKTFLTFYEITDINSEEITKECCCYLNNLFKINSLRENMKTLFPKYRPIEDKRREEGVEKKTNRNRSRKRKNKKKKDWRSKY